MNKFVHLVMYFLGCGLVVISSLVVSMYTSEIVTGGEGPFSQPLELYASVWYYAILSYLCLGASSWWLYRMASYVAKDANDPYSVGGV